MEHTQRNHLTYSKFVFVLISIIVHNTFNANVNGYITVITVNVYLSSRTAVSMS